MTVPLISLVGLPGASIFWENVTLVSPL
jgi:hypothetical protein